MKKQDVVNKIDMLVDIYGEYSGEFGTESGFVSTVIEDLEDLRMDVKEMEG